jgi:hypothetical protein
MSHPWKYCLAPVPPHGENAPDAPSVAFLEQILSTISSLPDSVFAENPYNDIYGVLENKLGPFSSIPYRKAAMCEALRVDAGYESNNSFTEGADASAGPEKPDEQETGAWQVSANSMALDPTGSLKARVLEMQGLPTSTSYNDLVRCFIPLMKNNPGFSVEYAARLFRFNTRWSGPCNVGWVAEAVTSHAATEWQNFLYPQS